VKGFRARKALQLPGVIRVAGEDENLVICGEGCEGLDGGGAAVLCSLLWFLQRALRRRLTALA